MCRRLADDSLEHCPHDRADLLPPDPILGRTVDGKYHVDAHVGSGGMGSVYRATQIALDRTVAAKFLKLSVLGDPNSLERFRREALLLAGLEHPQFITVHDYGIAPERQP